MKTKQQIWAEQLKRYTDHETTDLNLVVEDAMRLYADECMNEICKELFITAKSIESTSTDVSRIYWLIDKIEHKSFE